jgi:hypothetical protein
MQGFTCIPVKTLQNKTKHFSFFLLPRLSRQGHNVGRNAGRDAMHCVSTTCASC